MIKDAVVFQMKALLFVETNMSAHMSPTCMEAIAELADSFAKRLATRCPFCYNLGLGSSGTSITSTPF